MMNIYRTYINKYNWGLNELDETNLETLIDFMLLKTSEDKNTKIINGQTYMRAEKNKPPSWL